jgi:fatty-acyl-CoA synthase
MQGSMQNRPLTIDRLFTRGEQHFGHKTVTSVEAGQLVSATYADWAMQTRKLGGALETLGVARGARVGTFAWNSARHLALYFAVPSSGRVLHPLNIRLFPDQITYIVNHAEDKIIFCDRSLLSQLAPLLPNLPNVRQLVVMNDGTGEIPHSLLDRELIDFDELVSSNEPVEFSVTDENSAASMCYTSGTTGNPKGVVYSHRSTFLHSMGLASVDTLGVRESDRILPVVPMFHANAWGLPHAAVATGAALVMPGSDLSGPALGDLIVNERVTLAAGVPTIWMNTLPHLIERDTTSLRLIAAGGAAVPVSLSEAFRESIGLPIQQAWGMTETSPLAAVSKLDEDQTQLSVPEQARLRAGVGRVALGVEARIVNPDTGIEVPHDGTARGELQVAGPWIAGSYFRTADTAESFTSDGWLRTGDVATMDARGWITLVDRTKDLIKSGGEWVSSVEMENHLMSHPSVLEAAVIGAPHPKWSERPVACIVLRDGHTLTKEQVWDHLAPHFAKWQLPEGVVYLDEVPKTSVGKFSKVTLREQYIGIFDQVSDAETVTS